MNIEDLREICLSFPMVEEDVKWENDLCFLVFNKMFCVTGLEGRFEVAFKVPTDIFDELVANDDIVPSPYLGRYHWVLVKNPMIFNRTEWESHLRQSFDLISAKLPLKYRKRLQLP